MISNYNASSLNLKIERLLNTCKQLLRFKKKKVKVEFMCSSFKGFEFSAWHVLYDS